MGRADGVVGEAMFAYELGMKACLVVVIVLAVFPFVVIDDLAMLTGFGSKESSKVATGSANGVKPCAGTAGFTRIVFGFTTGS